MKKRVLSGIQPSGALHIGNYLGAIKNWVDSQEENENFFCIVDLHAITVPQDPKELKKNIRDLAALYFAAGIDPQKSAVFIQSRVSAHAELAWILNTITPIGWMNRMTQYKDKSQKQGENTSVGLFDYPVLMAADILLYQADLVPVGDDQKQHVEVTRDLAQKFNSTFGEVFKIPEFKAPKVGARVMGLDDPTKKMSKSESNPNHAVYLLDTPDQIREKIKRATTDSNTEVSTKSGEGIDNLMSIYAGFTGMSKEECYQKFSGQRYGQFKEEVAEAVVKGLEPLQFNYDEMIEGYKAMGEQSWLERTLKIGEDKAREVAEKTLKDVKEKVGLG